MPERIILKPYDTYGVATFVVEGGVVYIGHFGGMQAPDGTRMRTIEEQTRQAFLNLDAALGQIGLSLKHMLKVTVILRNIVDFDAMHAVWQSFFPADYPARTTITSDFVEPTCLIQIEGIASTT
ncbi:MAG: RidA family protein [Anaerolineae bacterium]|nr:RidA family protein [Anaerolineae bacterium]